MLQLKPMTFQYTIRPSKQKGGVKEYWCVLQEIDLVQVSTLVDCGNYTGFAQHMLHV